MIHDEIESRRKLLELWLDILEKGYSGMRRKIAESNGEPVPVPSMTIDPPSWDMMEFMTQGLRRAISGDNDPFRILPPRGKRPKLAGADQIALAMQVLSLKESGKNEEESIEIAAESFGVSSSTAKNIFYARKEWARITIEAYRNRLIS